MSGKLRNLSVQVSGVSLVLLLMSGFGMAQDRLDGEAEGVDEDERTSDAGGENSEHDRIIVTARRRKESVLEAPAAVNVLTAADFKDAGIERVEDAMQLIPNVTLATSQGIGTTFLTIRGISQVRNSEMPVAVVIDGVQQFSPRQFRQELFDIESMQVVKGPQGAIYGRNATGGAIIVTTKAPRNEPEGYFSTGYGDGNEYQAEGSLSGALIPDELFGKVSVRYIDRDGFITNITRQEKNDPFEDLTLRTRMIWEPTSDISFDFRASYQDHEGQGIGFQFQAVDLADDNITGIGFGTDTGPIDADNVLPPRNNNPGHGIREMADFSLKVDWEGKVGTFTSVTSFTNLEENVTDDQFPFTAAMSPPELFGNDGTQSSFVDLSAWSQEFRFTSRSDRRLRWEAGLYYLDWNRFRSLSTGVDTGQGVIRLERRPTNDPRNPTNSFFADDNDNLAFAFFGQVNYDLTPDIELSAAGRFDEEEREQFVSLLQFPEGAPGARKKETFNKFSPKITARYMPSDFITVYGTWGEGFRSGQFNQSGVGDAAAEVGLEGLRDVTDQEETESFELGFKSQLLNYGLDVEAAVFYTELTNQQVFSFIGEISAQVLSSIDEVDLWGGELELNYTPPGIDGLAAYLAWGHTDSEIKRNAVIPESAGNTAPFVAENTVNAGIQYRYPVGIGGLGVFARIDYEHRGEQFWDARNTTARSGLDFFNVRIGIEEANQKWSLIGEVDNATDEIFNSEFVEGGFSAAAPGRIWRVNFRYNLF